MLATALASTLFGLDGVLVRVEVEAARGVPSFELVGLAEAAVRESRVRVKSALAQIGVDISEHRVTVNMAPADLKKSGSSFDLAIAVATLVALGKVTPESIEGTLFIGELSLTGAVHAVRGTLPRLLTARACGIKSAVVPRDNLAEASLVSEVATFGAATLAELAEALRGEGNLTSASRAERPKPPRIGEDLSDVRGQASARRAVESAAAGGHNLLMIGSPGAGKTMLARRLPGILPALSFDEAVEVAAIHSIAGILPAAKEIHHERPFRSPHHTVSEVGLVGGGDRARPGEVSLAHRGVLFLDELPEFRRSALEALRQPLEDGHVVIVRAEARATYPARAIVVGAMNPCPCGHLGDGTDRCGCAPERLRAYRARVSGPLLDRIDVHVALSPVKVGSLQKSRGGESSESVRARVNAARDQAWERFQKRETSTPQNAMLSLRDLERVAALDERGSSALALAVHSLGLSARAYTKVLRVARTIADLAGNTGVSTAHVAEAIGTRVLDRVNGHAGALAVAS